MGGYLLGLRPEASLRLARSAAPRLDVGSPANGHGSLRDSCQDRRPRPSMLTAWCGGCGGSGGFVPD